MAQIIPENPQGRKPKEEYNDWLHQIARAKLKGEKPPRLLDLAGLKLSAGAGIIEKAHVHEELDRIRDRFKKARKRAQIPAPPKT